MNTKLTLTVEREVVERAKKYARKEGRSLSDIVESYLKALSSETNKKGKRTGFLVQSLRGSFKAPKKVNYKAQLSEILYNKYLKDE
ncbi:MAG: hypothetical protein GX419_03735 [Bacteroidales bacterium]|jgi:hypothetical protein|nr:hypothetical protein [Bacteroidales bacterium]